MKNATITTDCIDLLADFNYLLINEQMQVFSSVIDTLGSYSKPAKKGNNTPVLIQKINAYLFISNVRNACKLGVSGAITPVQAYQTALTNLENALTELLK